MSKTEPKQDAKKTDAVSDGSPAVRAIQRVLEWPGMLGWFGVIFSVAALWFLVSSFVLGSAADALDEDLPSAVDAVRAAEIAEGARSLGFGERLLLQGRLLRAKTGAKTRTLEIATPLKGVMRRRVQMAVAANARSSWVFGLHTLFVAAFLWGLRLFEPAIRAEHEPPPEKKVAA